MADPKTPTNEQILPLSDEQFAKWKSRIQASKDMIDEVKDEWAENKERYLLKKKKGQHESEVIVPKDFAFVEQKKAALFFQTPTVLLSPKLPGLEPAVPVFEAVLNHHLGRDGVNAKAAIDEVLSDALCPSGIFAVKVGYEATIDGTKQVQVGTEPDPNWVAPEQEAVGAVLGLNPPPQPPQVPKMEDVPNIICQKYIFERISPTKLLLPSDFTGSDYDKAAYVGMEFLMDAEVAKRVFNLPQDFNAWTYSDDRLIGKDDDTSDGDKDKRKKVKGWEIWYKTAIFDGKVKHPDAQRLLVVVEGMEKAAVHKDSPYQTVTQSGDIEGMPGFPIHIGALRYVSDSALPPSDASMTRYQVDEISTGRTHMKWQRQRSLPMRAAELAGVGGPEGLAKIEKNIWQSIIPLDSISPMPIVEIPRSNYPQENYQFDQIATRDLEEVWSLGANPTGALNQTNRTATELALAQNNSGSRLGKERNKFIDWFVRGVEKLAALVQLFEDEQTYVAVTGPDGVKRIQPWDKTTIAGKYAFSIKPNSFAPQDVASERSEFLQFYNLMANSPNVNRVELESELVRKFGLDPAKMIKVPPPPVQKPEEPKVSISIDENCLTPTNPAFPVFIEILKSRGINIPDAAIQLAQMASAQISKVTGLPTAGTATPPPPPATGQLPNVPGVASDVQDAATASAGTNPQVAAQKATPVNKHQEELTGERTGPKPGGFARLNKP